VPGNRQLFDQALKRGNQLVWDKAWDKALAEYETALNEFPENPIALASAGFVYTQLKRLDDALIAYQNANRVQPNDPAIISRLAEVQERLGLAEDAIESLLSLGDLYSIRKTTDKAIQCWERVVKLALDNVEAHQRLAAVYETMGKNDLAAREHTTLAQIYQKTGQTDKAVAATQAALTFAPRQTGLLRALGEIGSAGSLPAPPPAAKPAAQEPAGAVTSFGWDLDNLAQDESEAGGRGSPLEIARDKAMSDLAETLFEDADSLQLRADTRGAGARLNKAEIDAFINQALDYQTRGQLEDAIAAYRHILGAVDMAAARFNLGLLYEQQMRFDEAIAQFTQAVNHPDYTVGSHFALGECYRALDRSDEALEHFIEVLKLVDLQMVRREQADDLIALYGNLAESYRAKGDRDQAISFTNSLVEFLSNRGWEDKASEARKRLDSIAEEGSPAVSLVELFTIPNAEQVLQFMAASQEHAKQGKYYIATDELYQAIQVSPDYLPVHLRLAELLWAERHSEEAVIKLRTIANTYQVRGDLRHAMNIYERILRMTPMDIPTRTMLIGLLLEHNEIDGALDQYMQLADTYYQLAQVDKARETYQEALSYITRGSTGKLWAPKIYNCLGDIDMQRIDWRRAIQDYEQAKAYAPEDEKARLSLVELYYKVGQKQRAQHELDGLLELYKAAGKTSKMIAVLEDQVHIRPTERVLRSRLARVYVEAGMRQQAIEQLDALGEMQLQAGLKKEAAMTIRGIIALGPSNLEDYKQLLIQIGTSLLGPTSGASK
jgi:tetratricopeptide (TPR) repeat protein